MNLSLQFAYAYGEPDQSALFRTEMEDFKVVEHLDLSLGETGEHVYLYVEKRDNNTAWLAKQIAQLAGVRPMDVGYCGLKDRRAVTQQWFSVYLPKGMEPNWAELNGESFTVLKQGRGPRKLRRGDHVHNSFTIRLRNLSQSEDINRRLQLIEKEVPNYFGEQRFGIEGNNLLRVKEWFEDGKTIKNRQQRGLIMSAARSYLFNLVLSDRINKDSWQGCMEGEVLLADAATAPLWGRGQLQSEAAARELEVSLLEPFTLWQERLEHLGLSQDRRLLSLTATEFSHRWLADGADLELSFNLPPGTYATAILRELCKLIQPELINR